MTAILCCAQASAPGISPALASDPAPQISQPSFNADRGTWGYQVRSTYLAGMNEVEALLPKDFDPTRRYRALYVLPVEAGRQTQFGDPGTELTQLGIADRYGLLCVIPRFDTMPWYGAHATHPRMRHEEYLKEVVVPLIESCYPVVGGAEGRLLLGFSKSGFGAYSLILRDPAFFGYAAAWDAPLMLSAANYGAYETAAHFGSRENFRKYLPLELLARNAHAFTDKSRLVLAGSSLFGDQPGDLFRATPHTATFHQRMEELGVQHRYNNELPRKHHWNSGWMGPVVEALMSLVQDEDQASAQT